MLDKPSAYVNYDTSHHELTDYQYLNNKIFTDPNTGRPYKIAVICYDKKTKEPIAYRRNLDDLPADPFDDFPFRVKGEFGIETLVRKYEANHNNHPDDTTNDAKWPTSEEEMLDLQRQDPYWGPFVEKLEKMWDDQTLTPNDRHLKVIEDITGNQTIMLLQQQDRTKGVHVPMAEQFYQLHFTAKHFSCTTINTDIHTLCASQPH